MKTLQIRGEAFAFFPERAAYRAKTNTLLVADLHWGKAEIFQKSGISVSSNVLDDDLARLSRVLEITGAEKLWILGDLIHSPKSVIGSVHESVSKWREKHADLEMTLIRGNHDRRYAFPDEWRLTDAGTEIADGEFLFVHDEPKTRPKEKTDRYLFLGHMHPVLDVSSSTDRIRLPCFVVERDRTWLPAFSAFTGGAPIPRPAPDTKVFAIGDERLIEF